MLHNSVLNDADIPALGDAVLEVLEQTGVLCQCEELLHELGRAGARIDAQAERVTFSRNMTSDLLEQLRGEPHDGGGAASFVAPGLPHLGTQIAQFTYDHEAGERRSGNRADFIELIKLGSVLHPQVGVGHCLVLTEVPALLEPLVAALLLAKYGHRPAPAFAWDVRQVEYLIEIGDILGREDWYTLGAVCFAHPLRFDRHVAERLVHRARSGESTGLTAMPVAGVTTPLPLAGFIAVATAEIVATWLAARAVNPEVDLGGSIWGGAMDMKTGTVSYCSHDAMLHSFALREFLLMWTGRDLSVGGGEYCDARSPGHYAALEKAYKAMMIAAFTGRHPDVGQGMLEDGKVLCPVQLLLERELGTGVQFLGRSIEVTPETICMDSILDVGSGLSRSHLDTEATLANWRQHAWCPEFLDRTGWKGPETDAATLQKMQDRYRELVAAYERPAVTDDQLTRMRAVVDRASRELVA